MSHDALPLPIALHAPLRFTMVDWAQTVAAWGWNGAPGSLCALLGLTPAELRPHMLDFKAGASGTSLTLVRDVLERLGMSNRLTFSARGNTANFPIPAYGLMRLQWSGPWCRHGRSNHHTATHTHWIGTRTVRREGLVHEIFDVHAMHRGGWVSTNEWSGRVVPEILRTHVPHSDGHWWVLDALEVWK